MDIQDRYFQQPVNPTKVQNEVIIDGLFNHAKLDLLSHYDKKNQNHSWNISCRRLELCLTKIINNLHPVQFIYYVETDDSWRIVLPILPFIIVNFE